MEHKRVRRLVWTAMQVGDSTLKHIFKQDVRARPAPGLVVVVVDVQVVYQEAILTVMHKQPRSARPTALPPLQEKPVASICACAPPSHPKIVGD